MDDRIRPDYSYGFDCAGEHYLIDRTYDHIHLFPWLGHAILKLITGEGVASFHLPQDQGEFLAEGAGVTPIIRSEISEREYAMYLRHQEMVLDEDWLE